uniref:Uncharacterized protein n=1 Tax=Cucumis melo TaxID=3656 RepID=A0A9I9DBC5_CUCME
MEHLARLGNGKPPRQRKWCGSRLRRKWRGSRLGRRGAVHGSEGRWRGSKGYGSGIGSRSTAYGSE